MNDAYQSRGLINAIEYDIASFNESLSSINPAPLNKVILFPNPTTSKIALNSNKDYEIEIFDMTGNKVMETSGNTIDLSVLSSAIYIVKTLDKMTKETNSYKVVKN
ncbi:T9SS type A sorting domain-containing protein [Polaribacter sp.]|uniref:T9SS type A sorting domain-containing protein n=1 Tax=Polaribacter sp. TaxID=1920175 RepID=UPI0025D212FB|nr:T9SS type A sorting domain-containing protein [Polaribacter sp.]